MAPETNSESMTEVREMPPIRNEYLAGLIEERETIATAIEGYTTRASERGTDLSDAEVSEVAELSTRAASIDTRLATFGEAQQANRAYSDLVGRLDTGRANAEERQTARREDESTLGAQFVAANEYRSYREHGHGTSGVFEAEFRAPTLLANLARDVVRITIPEPADRFPLFGLTDIQTIAGNAFDYVVGTFTDASAVVAEGAAKPESTYSEALVNGVLDTIAHWTQISRQALEDEGRVRSIIDGKLTRGVLAKQHASIAAALTAATLPAVDGAGDLLAGIRVGIGTVEAAGFVPNVVLLNPADWASLDVGLLNRTTNASATSLGQSFWGLRPVAYTGQAAGVATVGDFQDGVTLFRRSGVSVYATDSHADAFIKNIFTILAEARSKAVVTNAAAFAEVSEGVAP
jgi:hypothetical protein